MTGHTLPYIGTLRDYKLVHPEFDEGNCGTMSQMLKRASDR